MTQPLDRLTHFIKRTNLARLLALYFSAAFVALQLVDMFAERLNLPDALFTITLVLILAGLVPLVLWVAWRARATSERAHAAPHTHGHGWLTWRRTAIGIVGLLALWGVVAAGWMVLAPESSADAKAAMGTLRVRTPSRDVRVTAQRVTPIDSFAQQPVLELAGNKKEKLPAGEYLLRIARPGYNEVTLLRRVEADAMVMVPVNFVRDVATTRNMVHVPERAGVAAFLIDKYEVTNAQYLEFIKAGGYQQAALAKLVDRTGTPGPRDWSGGVYPEGTGDWPVTGVSWVEADAYARWLGKQLPTWQQWWHAALGEAGNLPWGRDTETTASRANFGLNSAGAVGSFPLGVSHAGAFDMAGNVREWLRTPRSDPEKRVAVGGAWQDPTYVFDPEWVEEFPRDYASELIGFRCVIETKGDES